MGKTHRRYRGVDLEARRKAFGDPVFEQTVALDEIDAPVRAAMSQA